MSEQVCNCELCQLRSKLEIAREALRKIKPYSTISAFEIAKDALARMEDK